MLEYFTLVALCYCFRIYACIYAKFIDLSFSLSLQRKANEASLTPCLGSWTSFPTNFTILGHDLAHCASLTCFFHTSDIMRSSAVLLKRPGLRLCLLPYNARVVQKWAGARSVGTALEKDSFYDRSRGCKSTREGDAKQTYEKWVQMGAGATGRDESRSKRRVQACCSFLRQNSLLFLTQCVSATPGLSKTARPLSWLLFSPSLNHTVCIRKCFVLLTWYLDSSLPRLLWRHTRERYAVYHFNTSLLVFVCARLPLNDHQLLINANSGTPERFAGCEEIQPLAHFCLFAL